MSLSAPHGGAPHVEASKFDDVNEEALRAWVDVNAKKIKYWQPIEIESFWRAVIHRMPFSFLQWLVDEKGVNVKGWLYDGETALHYPSLSVEKMAFLLDRGVDPSVSSRNGRTPLHVHCSFRRYEAVKLLLQYPRTIAAINRVATVFDMYTTALYLTLKRVMREEPLTEDALSIFKLLLAHGAQPNRNDIAEFIGLGYLRRRYTTQSSNIWGPPEPLAFLPFGDGLPNNLPALKLAAIALLEQAIFDPDRTYLLSKARWLAETTGHLNTIKEATNDSPSPQDQKQKLLAFAPAYLTKRIAKGVEGEEIALPLVEVSFVVVGGGAAAAAAAGACDAADGGGGDGKGEGEKEQEEEGRKKKEEEEERLVAVLRYVVGVKEGEKEEGGVKEGGGGGGGGGGGSMAMIDVHFTELMEMMAPLWKDALQEEG
jgi:hypothetical protein